MQNESPNDIFKWSESMWCYRDELETANNSGFATADAIVFYEGTEAHTIIAG